MSNVLVRKASAPLVAALALSLAQAGHALPPPNSELRDVSITRPFFNPALGQKIGVSFNLDRAGSLTVLILDRDGYLVRRLVSGQTVQPGKQAFDWDGRDDKGHVVPDEAYSLKIDLAGARKTASYFPARLQPEEIEPKGLFYDRQGGTVGYKLARPARVHVQAGSNRFDEKTGGQIGPALRTIANREPRVAGSVVEPWDGYDQGGTVYVPDLPHFSMSLVATALPENALITTGNRGVSFLEYLSHRHGQSLLTAPKGDHSHHRGLPTLRDVSPELVATVRNASWSSTERLWHLNRQQLSLEVGLRGPSSQTFSREPGVLSVFLDEEPIRIVSAGPPPIRIEVSVSATGTHRVAVNWISDYGPVSVASFRLRVGEDPAPSAREHSGE
jgi:hypothetical protein